MLTVSSLVKLFNAVILDLLCHKMLLLQLYCWSIVLTYCRKL